MLYELGRLPEEEEHIQINYEGFSFIAVKWDAHMITKIRIKKLPEGTADKKDAKSDPEERR